MKNNEQRQKFSIRKLSVGVASVTIASFMMGGAVIAAETNTAETTAKATTGELRPEMDIYRKPITNDGGEGTQQLNALKQQIVWADFSDVTNLIEVKDKDGKSKQALQVGSKITLKPQEGLIFTAEVIELRPFIASETYKNRVWADTEINPDDSEEERQQKEKYRKSYKPLEPNKGFLIPEEQNETWSNLAYSGLNMKPKKVTISTASNGDAAGVVFKITASYNGKEFKPSMIVTDGEEQDTNGHEWTAFITDENASPWELVANVGQKNNEAPKIVSAKEYDDKLTIENYYDVKNGKYLTGINAGLGTHFFGGYSNNKGTNATPIAMAHDVSQLELYIASTGKQASMFGFVIMDNADAPDSYHGANHFMGANKDESQPYLGTILTDADYDLEGKDWFKDDATGDADEGVKQLMGDKAILGKDGKTYYYKYQLASDHTYELPIIATPGQNEKSYVRGWIDTNNDGEFSDDEASELLEVTKGKATPTHNLVFKNQPQITDPTVEKIGMRVRTALIADNIASPTGSAFSGEVEDFQIQIVHPPRGTKETTTGNPGEKQTATVVFDAHGKEEYSETVENKIDETVAPTLLAADGSATTLTDGYYVVPGEGKYKITGTGKDVAVEFIPEEGFYGQAKGIIIRRQDTNGNTTEWNNDQGNVSTQTNTMDGVYLPSVPQKLATEDLQGETQNSPKPTFDSKNPVEVTATNPAKFVDAEGNDVPNAKDDKGNDIPNTIDAMKDGEKVGTYKIDPTTGKVTFTPNKDFVGTPDPAIVQAKDANGTPATATYTPTVTPVTPKGEIKVTTDFQGQPQKGQPNFTAGNDKVPMDDKVAATFKDGSTEKVVKGEGTYTVAKDGTVTFKPEPQFTGKAKGVTVVRQDTNGTPAEATYIPVVNPVTPTGEKETTKGPQGQDQSAKVDFTEGNNKVLMDDTVAATFKDGSTEKVVKGEGTYTVAEDGTVTFKPEPTFTGVAKGVTVVRQDTNGTKAEGTYTPTVEEVIPTGENESTTGRQGQDQSAKVDFTQGHKDVPMNDKVPATFEDGTTTKAVPGVGTYEVAPDGTVTFKPLPGYVTDPDHPAVPVTVIRQDINGTIAKGTYTPVVEAVKPTAVDAESQNEQGKQQTGVPEFIAGDANVPMDDKVAATFKDGSTEKVVKGEGTYTVAPDGTVTFTPEPQFIGQAKGVTVVRQDTNGTPAEATYKPTVTPVKPEGIKKETTDLQGKTQTGQPTFIAGSTNAPMNDDVAATFADGSTEKVVKGEGTYTVAKDGTVTFTPEPQFTGVAKGVTVVREDKNGTKAEATYQPTVTPVVPTSENEVTMGPQGEKQSAKVDFTAGDTSVPMNDDVAATFADGSTEKVVEGEGTYTVAKDGTVTFTPEPQFTGVAKGVTVVREDKNGTKAEGTYQPTVTRVKPIGISEETTDVQGQEQSEKVKFVPGDESAPINDKVPATFADGSTEKVVEGEGTYTVAADGTVTFKPEPQFTGTGTGVTVVRVDTNGTPAEATYTPTVTEVTPVGTPVETTDVQGKVQEGTPEFTTGDEKVAMDISEENPAKFVDAEGNDVPNAKDAEGNDIPNTIDAMKDGEKVGTYEIDPTTGKVTFTPKKDFVGTPVPATVQAKDTNGTPATATYTPTVTPVTPVGTPVETTDVQGKVQEGKPEFTSEVGMDISKENPAKFVDAEGNDVPNAKDDKGNDIPNTIDAMKDGEKVGTYEIDPTTGKVTFTPNKDFVGTPVPATVQAKDANGTPATATYTPTVTEVTPVGTPATSEDVQGQVQEGTPAFTSEVGMDISEENPAKFVDAEGNDVPNAKDAEGNDIPNTINAMKDGKIIGTYEIDPTTGKVTFTPNKDFVGTPVPATVQAKDANGTPATATYTPTVTEVKPTTSPKETTDVQGKTQTGQPTFTAGNDKVPMDKEVAAKLKDENGQLVDSITIDGEGTYTVAPDGTVTFEPVLTFSGQGTGVTVVRQDTNGTKAEATYTPTVTPFAPIGIPTETVDIQGKEQSAKVEFIPGDDSGQMDDKVPATFKDGSTEKVVKGEGTYTVAPDGTVTFKPVPTFTGEATGVTVVRQDTNGTKAEATYTPAVEAVIPTAEKESTTGPQGQEQSAKVDFTQGHKDVPMNDKVPATFEDGTTTKEVPGVGTYTVDSDGTVTFKPEKGYVTDKEHPAVPVTVIRQDINGTIAKGTYTPVVEPVEPTAVDATTQNEQGQTQTGMPEFIAGDKDVPMDDKVPATFKDGSTEKVVKGEGTYTVAPDGTVTFTPEPQFTGEAKGVTVVRQDTNGTKVAASYTPTVTPVKPTGVAKETFGKQGQEQSGAPTFIAGSTNAPMNDKVPATFKDGSTEKVVKGEGTYTVAPNGTVTFTPEPQFTGEAKGVTVVRVDTNGTKAEGIYTPTVLGVTPIGRDDYSTGYKGKAQSGTPTFVSGDQDVKMEVTAENPAKLVAEDGTLVDTMPAKDKEGKEIGTYTINPATGKVTFQPNEEFVGKPVPATVQAKDANGTTVQATYSPEVVVDPADAVKTEFVDVDGNPLAPVVDGSEDPTTIEGYYVDETIIGKDGNIIHIYKRQQTSFVDENGNELNVDVDGTQDPLAFNGYYIKDTITDENGNVTHIYARQQTSFVDEEGNELHVDENGTQDPLAFDDYYVKDTITDENGNVTHIYALKQTSFVDEEGNELHVNETGTQDPAVIDEYYVKETVTDENGNVTHIYARKHTSFVDENGNELNADIDGAQDPAIIDEYYVKETITDENGNTIHIYARKQTSFVDEEGNELHVDETGTQDPAIIDEYYVKDTITDENGNVTHIYARQQTSFVDEEGNELHVDENGTQDPLAFDDYYVKDTITDKNGNVTHIYALKQTSFVDEEGNELHIDETGTQDPAVIDDYYVKETVTDENGNVTHIYARKHTSFVDAEGNELHVDENGANDPVSIDDYYVEETKVDENGNTIHVYRHKHTRFLDRNGRPLNEDINGANDPLAFDDYYVEETKVDENGNTIHIYALKETSFVDAEGNELHIDETGTQDPAVIDDYYVEETKVDENGNTIHVYRHKHTRFLDRNGRPLNEDINGANDPLAFDDYYVEETKVDENGNTIHIYALKETSFVDAEGNELHIDETGTQDPAVIDDYYVEETKVDENGNVTHIYARKHTSFVDAEGNELHVDENGANDPVSIDDYYVEETKVDENGNTIHIYARKHTSFVDAEGNELNIDENGTKDPLSFDDYYVKETITDENGNVIHVYELKHTTFVDVDGNEISELVNAITTGAEVPGYVIIDKQIDENGNVIYIYEKEIILPESGSQLPRQEKELPQTSAKSLANLLGLSGFFTAAGITALFKRKK